MDNAPAQERQPQQNLRAEGIPPAVHCLQQFCLRANGAYVTAGCDRSPGQKQEYWCFSEMQKCCVDRNRKYQYHRQQWPKGQAFAEARERISIAYPMQGNEGQNNMFDENDGAKQGWGNADFASGHGSKEKHQLEQQSRRNEQGLSCPSRRPIDRSADRKQWSERPRRGASDSCGT